MFFRRNIPCAYFFVMIGMMKKPSLRFGLGGEEVPPRSHTRGACQNIHVFYLFVYRTESQNATCSQHEVYKAVI